MIHYLALSRITHPIISFLASDYVMIINHMMSHLFYSVSRGKIKIAATRGFQRKLLLLVYSIVGIVM